MDRTASAERQASAADTPADVITPEEKLICLGSWLERTTLKETQAAQACSILPASTLAIGAAFAGAFVGIDHRWSALVFFLVFAFGALALFLYHHRRWTIWKAVAMHLQTEQKLMIGQNRSKSWSKTGRHPPEQLARLFEQREPLRLLSGPALALYSAALILGMLLLVFAIAKDYDLLSPKPAAAAERPPVDITPPATVNGRPIL